MGRNKKMLLSFLALNTALSGYAVSAGKTVALNSDRLYNNMIKNLEQGKTNEGNYKLIEKVLNQRNKELKDLYLQSDYIVKPEYLEWQIFASAFYEEHGKGVDNTKENAKYRSQVSGYYDDNGNFVTTSGSINGMDGKPYQPPQQPKNINLGVSIPMKGMTREPLNLNITPASEININPAGYNFTIPSGATIPQVNPIEFQPISPSIPNVTVTPIAPVNLTFPGSGNGDAQWITQNGSVAPIAQQELTDGTLDAVSFSTNAGQNFNLSLHNTQAIGLTGTGHTQTNNGVQNFDWINQSSTHAVMKLVGSHTINIKNMDMNFIGVGLKPSAYLMLFHTDAHNFNTEDSVWVLDQNTTINMSGQTSILYGVQSHRSSTTMTTGSGMINEGTIIADAATSATTSQGVNYTGLNPYQRIVFTTIDADGNSATAYNRFFYFENAATGSIVLNGNSDILANFATRGGSVGGGTIFTNNGSIILNGYNSVGVVLNQNVTNFVESQIILNKPIELRGDGAI